MGSNVERRVSQGGEGRIRRVSPEEQRAMAIKALREGRSDIAEQRGWDLALEEVQRLLTERYHPQNPTDAHPTDVVYAELVRRERS